MKKVSRVLVISHMYPRASHPAGGIFVHEQVKKLRELGVDARVITGDPFWINTLNPLKILGGLRSWWRAPAMDWSMQDGVPVINFPYIVSSSFLPYQAHVYTYSIAALRCVQQIQHSWNFQLIHSHTAYLDGTAGSKISHEYGIPFIITEHTGPFCTLTRTSFLKRKTEKALNLAALIIAVSQSLLNDIKKEINLRKTGLVVPNVVDVNLFVDNERRPDSNGVKALWVGHFVPVKRVDLLIRAVKLVKDRIPNFVLTLVGSGELESDLRHLVNDLGLEGNINFAGPSDRKNLPRHYSANDFLIISSASETFGVVAIEAMSCGIPVLSTNCGGPAEIVANPDVGMVVGMEISDLADGIVQMAKNNNFQKDKIRKYAVENYSGTIIAKNLMNIYNEVVNV